MLELLKIPEQCLFPSPKSIPLDKICENCKPEDIDVSEINWIGTISPICSNVEAYKDANLLLEEIQLLHLCLTGPDKLYETAKAIYRALRYPCLLIMQYEGKYLLSACKFNVGKIDSDKNVLSKPCFSHWLHPECLSDKAAEFIDKINSQLTASGSLKDIYINILHEIQYFALGGIKSKKQAISIFTYLTGKKPDTEFLEIAKICTPYKRRGVKYSGLKAKYDKTQRTNSYTYSYDSEDVWYCLMTYEKTMVSLTNKRCKNIDELMYRMDYVNSDN